MDKIIGLKELRQKVSDYAFRVKKGESFIVVKQSKPLFKIVPLEYEEESGQWETVIDFTKVRRGGVPIEKVQAALKKIRENG